MTIDSIRDELARREGWRFTYSKHFNTETWQRGDRDLGYWGHPIPATLDEAAKLPEGWEWARAPLADGNVVWYARRPTDDGYPIYFLDTGNEMHARFRLRLACTLADEGSKP